MVVSFNVGAMINEGSTMAIADITQSIIHCRCFKLSFRGNISESATVFSFYFIDNAQAMIYLAFWLAFLTGHFAAIWITCRFKSPVLTYHLLQIKGELQFSWISAEVSALALTKLRYLYYIISEYKYRFLKFIYLHFFIFLSVHLSYSIHCYTIIF